MGLSFWSDQMDGGWFDDWIKEVTEKAWQELKKIGEMMDLKELMNHGFVIYDNGTKVTLKKIATPTDPRATVSNEITPDTSLFR